MRTNTDIIIAKMNSLKNWQAILLIVLAGILVYCGGLNTPFIGDDQLQIVDNVPVHSISNIKLFFQGSTFYNGEDLAPLTGSYYRPLMTTVFSLIYSIFGANSLPFHVVQLMLCIGTAIFLYLFLTYSFRNYISAFLALVFLIHPINSQVVYALPSMQDALFMFFGVFALWSLLRFNSIKGLVLTVLALTLSLLSKEAGILFVAMAFLYLFWFNRPRLVPFIALSTLPFLAYVFMKINAVGVFHVSGNAPISRVDFVARIMTVPSIFVFYLFKLIFPLKLASGYYWVHNSFSLKDVLLPLVVSALFIAAIIYLGILIRRKASKANFTTFKFFAIWWLIGTAIIMQIIPLDLTASETWFYFPSIGLLGMLGVMFDEFLPKKGAIVKGAILIGLIIMVCLGVRTNIRAGDRKDAYTLASNDIVASRENFIAYNMVAVHYINLKEYDKALSYAHASVKIFPEAVNYSTLGQALLITGDYDGAYRALTKGTEYQDLYALYANLSVLTLHYGDPSANQQFLKQFAGRWPNKLHPWFYLAITEYKLGNMTDAENAITRAHQISPNDNLIIQLYNIIMSRQPLNLVTN